MLIIMREREGHAGRGLFGPTVWVTMCKARGQYRVKKLKATWAYCGTKEETGVGMDAQSSKGCKVVDFLWEVLSNGSQQDNFYPSISTMGPEENTICETIIFFREVVFFSREAIFRSWSGSTKKLY
jgi:hypothetical protein